MNRMRQRWKPLAAWLALAGLLYHALIPAGFMPGDAAAWRAGAPLVLCSGQSPQLAALLGKQQPDHAGAHRSPDCAFAAAAAAAVPPATIATLVVERPLATADHALAAVTPRPAKALRPPVRGPPTTT